MPRAPSTCLVRLALLTAALAPACKPTADAVQESRMAGDGQPVSTIELSVAAASSGHLSLASEDPARKAITRVDSLSADVAITTARPAAATAYAEVGTLTLKTVAFQVNGISNCTKDFAAGGAVTCTNPAPVAPVTPPTAPEVVEPTAADFRARVVHHPGMRCGRHYDNGYKWQKAFDVGIDSDKPGALEAVEKVVHPVFRAYTSGPFEVTGAAGDRHFTTRIGFLTPVLTWGLDASTVHLKSGRSFTIAAGRVEWADDDPEKRANAPCTPGQGVR